MCGIEPKEKAVRSQEIRVRFRPTSSYKHRTEAASNGSSAVEDGGGVCLHYLGTPCFAVCNARFSAHVFEGKIRMRIIHGYNNGYDNPMCNAHKIWVCVIHGKRRYF